MPALMFVIVCTVQICNIIFLKQSLTVSAYEGARVAIIPGSTLENVQVQVTQILAERGAVPSSIEVTPAGFESAAPGTLIEVEVKANSSDFSLIGFLGDREVTASLSMMKEF